jgi:hypothetical protein
VEVTCQKQNQPLRLVSFNQFLLFKRSVIRFFSVLTRFIAAFVLSHADLALAEASRCFQRQHLLVSQHLQRHFLLDGTLFQNVQI